jgi:hypothetical protein
MRRLRCSSARRPRYQSSAAAPAPACSPTASCSAGKITCRLIDSKTCTRAETSSSRARPCAARTCGSCRWCGFTGRGAAASVDVGGPGGHPGCFPPRAFRKGFRASSPTATSGRPFVLCQLRKRSTFALGDFAGISRHPFLLGFVKHQPCRSSDIIGDRTDAYLAIEIVAPAIHMAFLAEDTCVVGATGYRDHSWNTGNS